MTTLSVYQQSAPQLPNKVLTHLEDISSTLAQVGVRFARWQASLLLDVDAGADALLMAYQAQVEQLTADTGLAAVEVVSYTAALPSPAESRAALLREHRHADAQVRYCVAGRGLLSLHIAGQVFEVLLEKGDLIALPAGALHWFDMGERPSFVAICLSVSGVKQSFDYSGDPISEHFSRLEEWM